jgi:hypothetical protein
MALPVHNHTRFILMDHRGLLQGGFDLLLDVG